jgi:hypothetical protein
MVVLMISYIFIVCFSKVFLMVSFNLHLVSKQDVQKFSASKSDFSIMNWFALHHQCFMLMVSVIWFFVKFCSCVWRVGRSLIGSVAWLFCDSFAWLHDTLLGQVCFIVILHYTLSTPPYVFNNFTFTFALWGIWFLIWKMMLMLYIELCNRPSYINTSYLVLYVLYFCA